MIGASRLRAPVQLRNNERQLGWEAVDFRSWSQEEQSISMNVVATTEEDPPGGAGLRYGSCCRLKVIERHLDRYAG